jgi:Domain of unknown function (DUF4396)
MTAIDGAIRLWFVLTGLAVLFVAYDVTTRTPAMTVMKWGWILVVAYSGPVGLFVYLVSCREPLAGTHEQYVAPLWKQAVGSTIHCVAGDATGIVAGALVALTLRLPKPVELALEYAAGFGFGLFIFQALFAKMMTGGGYVAALRRTLLPEWLSMNALMAGMIPVMAVLMAGDPAAMGPTTLRFWGVMSGAILVGALCAYPTNVWLVAAGKKHGMGTVQVLGRGGHTAAMEHDVMPKRARRASAAEVTAVTLVTVVALLLGLAIGAQFGVLGG